LEYLLFVTYLIFFAWLVTKIKFFTATGLSKPVLIIIFLLKVIAGTFYGWMGLYYGDLAQLLDTWSYHHNGIIEYGILQTDPKGYFTNIFHNPYENGLQNFFGSHDSYWNDLKSNVFIKLLSVFDIFSFGSYYVNVIFYSFLTLFGPIALYRVMSDMYPSRKTVVLIAAFFIPSFLYWSSGIHKEGLIFVAISLIIYHMYFGNKEKKYGIKRVGGIMLGLFLLLLLRNFIIIVIVPSILAWMLANRWQKYALVCFVSVFVFFGILFFTVRYAEPRFDFPQAVVDKQRAYVAVVGNSSIPIKELQPNVISFFKSIPQAITLSAIRPYPKDIKHLLSLAAALEINLLLLLFIFSLFARKKLRITGPQKNVVYFCIFFAFSILLGIGFSVNNLGAIVRYRSIIMPLLVVLVAVYVDWERISQFLSRSIKNNNNVGKTGITS
jgi:hypothetical protein